MALRCPTSLRRRLPTALTVDSMRIRSPDGTDRAQLGLFLHAYRDLGRQTPRVERVLAVGRAFLAATGLAAIYLDPTEPARFATLTYALLAAYALYSVAILVVDRRGFDVAVRFARILHAVDILWASALTFFSEGPLSPFFSFSFSYSWLPRTVGASERRSQRLPLSSSLFSYRRSSPPWVRGVTRGSQVHLST